MPGPSSGKRRTIAVDAMRFRRAGPPIVEVDDAIDAVPTTSIGLPIVVDVLRAADLVAFRLEAFGCELKVGGASPPALKPRSGAKAFLVVRFPFQHLGEAAVFETSENDPKRVHAPVAARPARSSRVAFDVPEGTEIEFSIGGILDALGRLPLRVESVGPSLSLALITDDALTVNLVGGVTAAFTAGGVVMTKTAKKADQPRLDSPTALVTAMRDLAAVRRSLATTAGVATRGVAGTFVDAGLVVPHQPTRVPAKVVKKKPYTSAPPSPTRTAIEAPFRLIISPDAGAGWAHANTPVPAPSSPHRVELWHSRLGRRPVDADNKPVDGPVDDRPSEQRVIRALWARDRERGPQWAATKDAPTHDDDPFAPFKPSLDSADRTILVRQTSEGLKGKAGKVIEPVPVQAHGLYLSSLGAWLDLHGKWETDPYSEAKWQSILRWDHVAPMGRDQFVQVVYPGYLFPFGHKAALIKVTERKMKDATDSIAGLYQRKFILLSEPVKTYTEIELPFIDARVTPFTTGPLSTDPGNAQNWFFWPQVNNTDFLWTLHCTHREHRDVKLVTPLLWVSDACTKPFSDVQNAYKAHNTVEAHGQNVAFAPPTRGGDTTNEVTTFVFDGVPEGVRSHPRMVDAAVRLPAVQQLSPVGDVHIKYGALYIANKGFGGANNTGEIWAELVNTVNLQFGDKGASSQGAGGFLQPSFPIEGLSRLKGAVGDITGMATQTFNPNAFLGGLPKLFGIVKLTDLLDAVGGVAPNVISESLARVEGILADLDRLERAANDAVAYAGNSANALKAAVDDAVNSFGTTLGTLVNASQSAVDTAMAAPITKLTTAINAIDPVLDNVSPRIRNELLKIQKVLREVVADAKLVKDLFEFLNGLASGGIQNRFHLDWRPKLQSTPIITLPSDGLVIDVDGRASGKGVMSVEVLAELRNFTLNLLPTFPLVKAHFDRMSFHAGSNGKTDVDVVFGGLEFVGILAFIETLKDVIPLDGFSDPPYLDVTPERLKAGFTLALPNVAIGVFALSNISLGADVEVPFLGKAVTVGFDFCSRERPFTLQVTFIGGGGWFMLRVSPDGLDVLELGLEAGATLSIDLGVASGSISAMIGVYMRLEGDGGSLTGYFRLRGEVDVLGLISASIELYMSLTYDFPTGKMIGKATITVEVDVLFFSGSVEISAERRFAGANGDPSFYELMDVQSNGTSEAWATYCEAFAAA
jgi:hypothetical protein